MTIQDPGGPYGEVEQRRAGHIEQAASPTPPERESFDPETLFTGEAEGRRRIKRADSAPDAAACHHPKVLFDEGDASTGQPSGHWCDDCGVPVTVIEPEALSQQLDALKAEKETAEAYALKCDRLRWQAERDRDEIREAVRECVSFVRQIARPSAFSGSIEARAAEIIKRFDGALVPDPESTGAR